MPCPGLRPGNPSGPAIPLFSMPLLDPHSQQYATGSGACVSASTSRRKIRKSTNTRMIQRAIGLMQPGVVRVCWVETGNKGTPALQWEYTDPKKAATNPASSPGAWKPWTVSSAPGLMVLRFAAMIFGGTNETPEKMIAISKGLVDATGKKVYPANAPPK
ncbi:hypothetical protein GP486_007133 [Trichoglossum hirsutum]|uniref:Uncharacterized protein n=1 Tax=Trichoglossum hirsutum TaxID=265104 RepID=A0A9P8IG11_9PEZI|nr:hypothetical protein GP486_007133 [Trichoglossum hirsutum]